MDKNVCQMHNYKCTVVINMVSPSNHVKSIQNILVSSTVEK